MIGAFLMMAACSLLCQEKNYLETVSGLSRKIGELQCGKLDPEKQAEVWSAAALAARDFDRPWLAEIEGHWKKLSEADRKDLTEAWNHAQKGMVAFQSGDDGAANEFLVGAAPVVARLDHPWRVALAVYRHGTVLNASSKPGRDAARLRAIQELRKALTICEELRENWLLQNVLRNLAEAERTLDLQGPWAPLVERSIVIARELGDWPAVASNLQMLGNAWRMASQPEKAESPFQQAEKILDEHPEADHQNLAYLLIQERLRNYEVLKNGEGIETQLARLEALATRYRWSQDDARVAVEREYFRGAREWLRGRYDRAQEHFRLASVQGSKKLSPNSRRLLVKAEEFRIAAWVRMGHGEDEGEFAQLLGMIEKVGASESELQTDLVTRTLREMGRSSQAAELSMSRAEKAHAEGRNFIEAWWSVEAAKCLASLAREKGKEAKIAEAWKWNERGLSALEAYLDKTQGDIPLSRKRAELQDGYELAVTLAAAGSGAGSDAQLLWTADRFLQGSLYRTPREIVPAKPYRAPADLGQAELTRLIGGETHLLFLLNAEDLQFVHRDPSGKVTHSSLPGGGLGLSRKLDLASRRLLEDTAEPSKACVSVLAELSNLLLPKKLCDVIPSGAPILLLCGGDLASFPLEALLFDTPPESEKPSWRHLPYWAIRNPIRRAPSLSALALLERNRDRAGGGARRAFVNPTLPPGLPALAETKRVIAAAAKRFPDFRSFEGDAASEARFRRQSSETMRLCFVMSHGELGNSSAGEPYLLLSPGEGQDGLLHVREILETGIKADLVLLGSCYSAGGETNPGDSPSGIGHAFLESGASAVLAGLFRLPQGSTADFFESVFLSESRRLSLALWNSRRGLIAKGVPPRGWAGLVLIGLDPDW